MQSWTWSPLQFPVELNRRGNDLPGDDCPFLLLHRDGEQDGGSPGWVPSSVVVVVGWEEQGLGLSLDVVDCNQSHSGRSLRKSLGIDLGSVNLARSPSHDNPDTRCHPTRVKLCAHTRHRRNCHSTGS